MNSNSQKLQLAGLAVCKMENEQYLKYEDADIIFPEELDLKIKKLIASYVNRHSLIKKSIAKVASIVVALLVLGGSVLVVNVEARNKLSKMIRKLIGTKIEYDGDISNNDNLLKGTFENVCVGWVPSEFELVKSRINSQSGSFYYKNKDDETIYILCSIIGENASVGFSNANSSSIASDIGEYKNLYYEYFFADENSADNNLLVINDIYNYYVSINSPLEKDVLFKIFDNLEIVISNSSGLQ